MAEVAWKQVVKAALPMSMLRWLLVLVAGDLVTARMGFAREDWKDGCPAYFPTDARPAYLPDAPVNEGPGSFGVLPDLDSLLGTTRVALELWGSYLAHRPVPDRTIDTMLGAQAFLQFSLKAGPTIAMRYTEGYGVGRTGSPGFLRAGNTQFFVGYRQTSYLFGPLLRVGGAIRLGGGGGPPWEGSDGSLIAQRSSLAALAPFRAPLFGFDRPFGVAAEARIELVGCQAPFLDLRVDAWTWSDGSGAARAVDVPMQLALGGYLLPSLAAFGAIGLELRSPASALPFDELVRPTLGLEYQFRKHQIRVGARAGAITGGGATGFDTAVTISLSPGWKGMLE